MIIGYTSGVFDLFHVGHVNILKAAKSMSDKLIVGVSTDELVKEYKNKEPIINYKERCEIVSSVKYVDLVVAQETMDKMEAWNRYKFNIMVVGDDWYKTKKWELIQDKFTEKNVKVIYIPYTKGVSSTKINNILNEY